MNSDEGYLNIFYIGQEDLAIKDSPIRMYAKGWRIAGDNPSIPSLYQTEPDLSSLFDKFYFDKEEVEEDLDMLNNGGFKAILKVGGIIEIVRTH
jgi:hypothetical protein